jgi:hypothetical protein
MRITKLPNGNLEMTADINEQREFQTYLGLVREHELSILQLEAAVICDYLINPMGDGVSYTQVSPEEIAALTNAPLISDGSNIYGYMDYQINNFVELLADGKTIIWQKG